MIYAAKWGLEGKKSVAQKIIEKYLQILGGDFAHMGLLRYVLVFKRFILYAPDPSKNFFLFYYPDGKDQKDRTLTVAPCVCVTAQPEVNLFAVSLLGCPCKQ